MIYFKTNVLDYLDLELDKSIWLEEVNRPLNTTKKFKLKHYSKWSKTLTDTFNRICGKTMKRFDYK